MAPLPQIDPVVPILETANLTKVYPGVPPVKALDGVTLRIEPGDLVAIVGSSGSGKSTLLNVMGGLDRPSSGSVRIRGLELGDLSDRDRSGVRGRMVGFVFQEFILLPGLTSVENVAEGLRYRGMLANRRRCLARRALDEVGLGHRHDHLPDQMSGGERQRVAIARTLVGSPEVILADEPTGNLDGANTRALIDLFRELNKGGTTIVIITHDGEVADACRRRIALRDGRVVEHTTR